MTPAELDALLAWSRSAKAGLPSAGYEPRPAVRQKIEDARRALTNGASRVGLLRTRVARAEARLAERRGILAQWEKVETMLREELERLPPPSFPGDLRSGRRYQAVEAALGALRGGWPTEAGAEVPTELARAVGVVFGVADPGAVLSPWSCREQIADLEEEHSAAERELDEAAQWLAGYLDRLERGEVLAAA